LLTIDILKGENRALKAEVNNRDRSETTAAVERLSGENQGLRLFIGEVLKDSEGAKERAQTAERGRREVQNRMRSELAKKNGSDDPLRRRDRFTDADEWVRHAIHLAWIDRLDSGDRSRFPLSSDYLVGPRFAESLEALDSGQLSKALKAVVDVISGYGNVIVARSVHALREGNGAAEDDVVRDDGARCMRAYIEQNTPSARRLHFWKLPAGRIELSRIVLHDDVRP
jgi:hypothetical protein